MLLRLIPWLVRPGLLRSLLSDFRLAVRLVREPMVPWHLKLLPLAALLYVVSPLDFVPDVFPLVGQFDDIGIALAALKAFIVLCPAPARTFHADAIAKGRKFSLMPPTDAVIEAEFRRG